MLIGKRELDNWFILQSRVPHGGQRYHSLPLNSAAFAALLTRHMYGGLNQPYIKYKIYEIQKLTLLKNHFKII